LWMVSISGSAINLIFLLLLFPYSSQMILTMHIGLSCLGISYKLFTILSSASSNVDSFWSLRVNRRALDRLIVFMIAEFSISASLRPNPIRKFK
jgi:hypothetical protein